MSKGWLRQRSLLGGEGDYFLLCAILEKVKFVQLQSPDKLPALVEHRGVQNHQFSAYADNVIVLILSVSNDFKRRDERDAN